jgi:hydroxyisourate hydrolase
MSGRHITHVLDLPNCRAAAGNKVELWRDALHVATAVTNADGRTDAPLVPDGALAAGAYEIVFHVGAYFGGEGFLDRVPVRFLVRDATARYHVPLLCSPWAYSTYRGS